MRYLTLLAVTLISIIGSAHAQFKFKSFEYPGSFLTTARGINDYGVIVGAYELPFQPRHALLIKNGQYIPILPNSILGINYSEATNINNLGDITGQMVDENGFGHGFLVKNGALTILDVAGASETFALGINDSGLVAGYWDLLDANFNTLAIYGFTWKDGVFIDTQINFPGAAGSGLFGVNSRGDLSGVWLPDLNGPVEHGFACPKAAPCFSFDAPVPGTILTQADEINARGQIVGIYTGEDGIWHSFLMVGASFTSFDFPGSTGTGAYGINSAGQLVGKYFGADGNTHGFLAEAVRK